MAQPTFAAVQSRLSFNMQIYYLTKFWVYVSQKVNGTLFDMNSNLEWIFWERIPSMRVYSTNRKIVQPYATVWYKILIQLLMYHYTVINNDLNSETSTLYTLGGPKSWLIKKVFGYQVMSFLLVFGNKNRRCQTVVTLFSSCHRSWIDLFTQISYCTSLCARRSYSQIISAT